MLLRIRIWNTKMCKDNICGYALGLTVNVLPSSTDLRRRIVRNFLDILILQQIRKGMMSGYDVMAYLQKQFGVSLSSGTVYGILYSMERQNLIEGFLIANKRVYRMTENRETSKLLKAYQPIKNLLNSTSVTVKY